MKKILALALASMLIMGGTSAAIAAATSDKTAPAPQTAEREAEQSAALYLVPGTYVAGGETVENTVSSGATKLSAEECAEIHTENAYLCSLDTGAALPVPTSERTDKDGNEYTFNGWWSIVDATVTYFTTVPDITETTFLYADWRTDLSQRKDPIEPGETTDAIVKHYMMITRAATGETEKLTLRVSGTDMPNADTLGYSRAVQLYNGWFELCPGDVISVYTVGLDDSPEAQIIPLDVSGRKITLENSGDGSNVTASYLTSSLSPTPTLTYRKSLKKRHYRIYIKLYSAGANMSIYMEPMD